jgi:prepilin-type N-terminal cleavage/methylation domain-containing protein
MKAKHNGGFSLIEVLIAMVILAMIVVPTCTALVMSTKINAKTEALTQAQLAVSSAVETLMSKGIDPSLFDNEETKKIVDETSFPGLTVTVAPVYEQDDAPETQLPYYEVTVTYSAEGDELAKVVTFIRKALPQTTTPPETEVEG